jgi:hypothetical protein
MSSNEIDRLGEGRDVVASGAEPEMPRTSVDEPTELGRMYAALHAEGYFDGNSPLGSDEAALRRNPEYLAGRERREAERLAVDEHDPLRARTDGPWDAATRMDI